VKTVLIIDDEPDIAKVIKEAIEEGIEGVHAIIETDFDNALSRIEEVRPDAVILDLMEGQQSTNLPGQRTWKSIWDSRLCPLVVYTGWEGDIDPEIPEKHPIVTLIRKGAGSETTVVGQLKSFIPATQAVKALRDEIEAVIHQVLRETAGAGVIDPATKDQLLHAGRRRIAASMDAPTVTSSRNLMSWEQYLVPAIGSSPLTGDVLVVRSASRADPASYRLVLTPSCDMVRSRNEPTVLVAKCRKSADLVNRMSLSLKEAKIDESATKFVAQALTPGVRDGFIPLPAFGELMPHMVANLKDLEVVTYDSIDPNDPHAAGFSRVASIDSPFREQISWAFLSTAARPGMPDRELQSWAKECIKAAASATVVSQTPAAAQPSASAPAVAVAPKQATDVASGTGQVPAKIPAKPDTQQKTIGNAGT
jgi:CheY-like chemotaxis protein